VHETQDRSASSRGHRFTEHWLASAGHRLFATEDCRYELRQQGFMLGVGHRF
jgi:hypothetical protein